MAFLRLRESGVADGLYERVEQAVSGVLRMVLDRRAPDVAGIKVRVLVDAELDCVCEPVAEKAESFLRFGLHHWRPCFLDDLSVLPFANHRDGASPRAATFVLRGR